MAKYTVSKVKGLVDEAASFLKKAATTSDEGIAFECAGEIGGVASQIHEALKEWQRLAEGEGQKLYVKNNKRKF